MNDLVHESSSNSVRALDHNAISGFRVVCMTRLGFEINALLIFESSDRPSCGVTVMRIFFTELKLLTVKLKNNNI